MSNREYKSVFANDFRELIAVKRPLGFKYLSEESEFLRINAFFANHGVNTKEISRELCEEWCRKRSYDPLPIMVTGSAKCEYFTGI